MVKILKKQIMVITNLLFMNMKNMSGNVDNAGNLSIAHNEPSIKAGGD